MNEFEIYRDENFDQSLIDLIKEDEPSVEVLIYRKNVFRAHKKVLLQNKYFKSMWNRDWMENRMNTIVFDPPAPITASAFDKLLNYFYKGFIHLGEKDIDGVIKAANYLSEDRILNYCIDYYKRTLKMTNVTHIAKIAEQEGLGDLIESVINLLSGDFDGFERLVPMEEVSPKVILRLLSEPKVVVNNEYVVLKAVCKWIASDESTRSQYAKELFSRLHFKHLSLDRPCMESICMSRKIRDTFSKTLQCYVSANAGDGTLWDSKRSYWGRVLFIKENAILSCWFKNNHLEQVTSDLSSVFSSFVVCGGRLFVIGGYRLPQMRVSTDVSYLDLRDNQLKTVAHTTQQRQYPILLAHDEKVYAFGSVEAVGSEVYDAKLDTWVPIDDITDPTLEDDGRHSFTSRKGFALKSGGDIYVLIVHKISRKLHSYIFNYNGTLLGRRHSSVDIYEYEYEFVLPQEEYAIFLTSSGHAFTFTLNDHRTLERSGTIKLFDDSCMSPKIEKVAQQNDRVVFALRSIQSGGYAVDISKFRVVLLKDLVKKCHHPEYTLNYEDFPCIIENLATYDYEMVYI